MVLYTVGREFKSLTRHQLRPITRCFPPALDGHLGAVWATPTRASTAPIPSSGYEFDDTVRVSERRSKVPQQPLSDYSSLSHGMCGGVTTNLAISNTCNRPLP